MPKRTPTPTGPLLTVGQYVPPREIDVQLRHVSGALWRRLKVEGVKRDLQINVLADQAVALWLDLNEGLADEEATS